MALSPYTDFADKALTWVRVLTNRRTFTEAERVDFLAAPVVADTIARQDAAMVPVAGILARDIVARAVDPF